MTTRQLICSHHLRTAVVKAAAITRAASSGDLVTAAAQQDMTCAKLARYSRYSGCGCHVPVFQCRDANRDLEEEDNSRQEIRFFLAPRYVRIVSALPILHYKTGRKGDCHAVFPGPFPRNSKDPFFLRILIGHHHFPRMFKWTSSFAHLRLFPRILFWCVCILFLRRLAEHDPKRCLSSEHVASPLLAKPRLSRNPATCCWHRIIEQYSTQKSVTRPPAQFSGRDKSTLETYSSSC